jgi:folate-binding protein YgfZ
MTQGYFPITDHILKITGDKAAKLLNGQLSNSILTLVPNSGNYNLLLNTKGKVQADMFVLNRGDFFELVVPEVFSDFVKDHLAPLLKLMRCEILDLTNEYAVFHLVCDERGEFSDLKRDQICEKDIQDLNVLLYRSDRLDTGGFDVRVSRRDKQSFMSFLKKNGFCELPYVKVDVTAPHLIREGKLSRALHFDKGCYLGQEIIARLKYKGQIKEN